MAFASGLTSLIAVLICEHVFRSCNAWVFYSRPDSYVFRIPQGVYKIRVLAMGAGGGGAAGLGVAGEVADSGFGMSKSIRGKRSSFTFVEPPLQFRIS